MSLRSYVALYLALIVASASVPLVHTAVAEDVPAEYSAMVTRPHPQKTDATGNPVLITVPNSRTTTYERDAVTDAITVGEIAANERADNADARAVKSERLAWLALITSGIAVAASALSAAVIVERLRAKR